MRSVKARRLGDETSAPFDRNASSLHYLPRVADLVVSPASGANLDSKVLKTVPKDPVNATIKTQQSVVLPIIIIIRIRRTFNFLLHK